MPNRQNRHESAQKISNAMVIPPLTKLEIFKSKLPKIFSFVTALFLGLGVPMMSTGNLWAPWLISIGILMISILIVMDDDVRKIINSKSKTLRIFIYILAFSLPFVFSLIITIYVNNNQRRVIENTPVFYGTLTPNNEAVPSLDIPKGEIALIMGDSFTMVTSQSNNYIFSEQNKPFLTISIKPNGSMMLTTKVTDSDGNEVVDIVNNKFQANQNYAFFPLHPNHYTLSVNDLNGTEVLNVDYMNTKVMRIVGNFSMLGYAQPVVISSTGITFPNGQTLSGSGINTIINITESKDGFIDFR